VCAHTYISLSVAFANTNDDLYNHKHAPQLRHVDKIAYILLLNKWPAPTPLKVFFFSQYPTVVSRKQLL